MAESFLDLLDAGMQTIDEKDLREDHHLSFSLQQIDDICSSQENHQEDRWEGKEKPSIKENLKSKIQQKYIEKGEAPIRVSFDPPPKYELTEQELKKLEVRKQRNRASANKSRIKRKQVEDNLRSELERLENDQKKLKREVQLFRGFEEKLRTHFAAHLEKCSKVKLSMKYQLINTQAGVTENGGMLDLLNTR